MCVGAVLTLGRVSFALTVEGRDTRRRVSAVDHRSRSHDHGGPGRAAGCVDGRPRDLLRARPLRVGRAPSGSRSRARWHGVRRPRPRDALIEVDGEPPPAARAARRTPARPSSGARRSRGRATRCPSCAGAELEVGRCDRRRPPAPAHARRPAAPHAAEADPGDDAATSKRAPARAARRPSGSSPALDSARAEADGGARDADARAGASATSCRAGRRAELDALRARARRRPPSARRSRTLRARAEPRLEALRARADEADALRATLARARRPSSLRAPSARRSCARGGGGRTSSRAEQTRCGARTRTSGRARRAPQRGTDPPCAPPRRRPRLRAASLRTSPGCGPSWRRSSASATSCGRSWTRPRSGSRRARRRCRRHRARRRAAAAPRPPAPPRRADREARARARAGRQPRRQGQRLGRLDHRRARRGSGLEERRAPHRHAHRGRPAHGGRPAHRGADRRRAAARESPSWLLRVAALRPAGVPAGHARRDPVQHPLAPR